ncbi:MAG: hypothetical protein VX017_05900, partial [Pseudomonadota bacterium]|nr:hypothetical protein [Pseudomonadota bacterium]
MMRSILISAAVLLAINSATLARANTDKLDNIAACAGVVLGNGAVDFYLGDEASFDAAAEVAYSAYLSEVLSGSFSQSDLQIADQILGGNLDKVINAYNSDNFDSEVYEEVVGCYRQLATQILENIDVIDSRKNEWQGLMDTSIQTIKRM